LPKRLLKSLLRLSGKPDGSLPHPRLNASFGKIIIITPSNLFSQIRNLVKTIPSGKVTTYGDIAKALGTNPRTVGWALRGNENVSIPCHRVVKIGGLLADNFSLGNWPEQRRRLQAEGLKFSGRQILRFDHHFIDLTASSTSV
jgi:methylated-DNA-protein-cysteine methyltransferase-like protein